MADQGSTSDTNDPAARQGSDSSNTSTDPRDQELQTLRDRLFTLEQQIQIPRTSSAAIDEKTESKRIYQMQSLGRDTEARPHVGNLEALFKHLYALQVAPAIDDEDSPPRQPKSLKKTIHDVGATSADIVLSDVQYPKRPILTSIKDFLTGLPKLSIMRNIMGGGTLYKRQLVTTEKHMAWEAIEVESEYPPMALLLFLWPVVVPFWILGFGTLTLLQFAGWRIGRKAIEIPQFSIGLEDTIYSSHISDKDNKDFKSFMRGLDISLGKSEPENGEEHILKVPRIERYRPFPDDSRNKAARVLPETLKSYGTLSNSQKKAVNSMIGNLSEIYLKCSQIHFRKIKDRWAVIGCLNQANGPFEKGGFISKFQLLAHTDAIDNRLSDICELVSSKRDQLSHYTSDENSYQDLQYELNLCGIICSIIIDTIPYGKNAESGEEDESDENGENGKNVESRKYVETGKDAESGKNAERTKVGGEVDPIFEREPSEQTVRSPSFPNTDIEEFLSYTIPSFLVPISMAFTAANTLINTFVAKDVYNVNASVLIAFAIIGMYSSIFMNIGSAAVNQYIFGGSFTYMHYAPISHRNVRWTGSFYFDTYVSFIRRQYSLLASFIEKSESGYSLADGTGLFINNSTKTVGSSPLRTVKTAYISDSVLEKLGFQLNSTTYVLPTEPNTYVKKVDKTRSDFDESRPIITLLVRMWQLVLAFLDIMLGWLIQIFDPTKRFNSRAVTNSENKGELRYLNGCRKAWEDKWHFCCPWFFFRCERCNLLDIKSFTIIKRSDLIFRLSLKTPRTTDYVAVPDTKRRGKEPTDLEKGIPSLAVRRTSRTSSSSSPMPEDDTQPGAKTPREGEADDSQKQQASSSGFPAGDTTLAENAPLTETGTTAITMATAGISSSPDKGKALSTPIVRESELISTAKTIDQIF